MQELKDESNPARVFSAIDDAGKRFTLDACYDLVHGVATAWALEARSKPRAARTGRTFLWFFTAVTLRQ